MKMAVNYKHRLAACMLEVNPQAIINNSLCSQLPNSRFMRSTELALHMRLIIIPVIVRAWPSVLYGLFGTKPKRCSPEREGLYV